MKFLPPFAICILSLGLSSCETSTKRETPPLMSQKMSRRLTKPDMNRKSIYDKDMQATFANKGGTDWLGRKKYGANRFTGSKNYTNTSKFKAGEFTSGQDQASFGDQKFSETGKTPSYADHSFTTKKSGFGNQSAGDANKAFSTDTFKTFSNRAGLKSQEENDRPKIIELDKKGRAPAYSEDQVRSLMGRD
jgi:hypothetical protein